MISGASVVVVGAFGRRWSDRRRGRGASLTSSVGLVRRSWAPRGRRRRRRRGRAWCVAAVVDVVSAGRRRRRGGRPQRGRSSAHVVDVVPIVVDVVGPTSRSSWTSSARRVVDVVGAVIVVVADVVDVVGADVVVVGPGGTDVGAANHPRTSTMRPVSPAQLKIEMAAGRRSPGGSRGSMPRCRERSLRLVVSGRVQPVGNAVRYGIGSRVDDPARLAITDTTPLAGMPPTPVTLIAAERFAELVARSTHHGHARVRSGGSPRPTTDQEQRTSPAGRPRPWSSRPCCRSRRCSSAPTGTMTRFEVVVFLGALTWATSGRGVPVANAVRNVSFVGSTAATFSATAATPPTARRTRRPPTPWRSRRSRAHSATEVCEPSRDDRTVRPNRRRRRRGEPPGNIDDEIERSGRVEERHRAARSERNDHSIRNTRLRQEVEVCGARASLRPPATR